MRNQWQEGVVHGDAVAEAVVQAAVAALPVFQAIAGREPVAGLNQSGDRFTVQRAADDQVAFVIELAFLFRRDLDEFHFLLLTV